MMRKTKDESIQNDNNGNEPNTKIYENINSIGFIRHLVVHSRLLTI